MVMCSIIGSAASRLVYNGLVSSGATSSSFTLLNVPLGDADASRVVYIAISTSAGSAQTSVTLGGVAMSLKAPGPTSSLGLSIHSLAFPTGTSATVFIDYGTPTGGGQTVFSYSAYNQQSTTATATANARSATGANVNVSANTSANGFLIGVSMGVVASATGWTGLTQDGAAAPVATFLAKSASASYVVAAAPRAITATASGATTNQAVVLSMP